jgi:phosphate transport system substrate-binding protein
LSRCPDETDDETRLGKPEMFKKPSILTAVVIGAVAMAASAASARDQIRIVGSSTVFPFSATVAEQFGKTTDFATPFVEATGSGGGLKLFCSGVGANTPDITNSSRRMKLKEWKQCNENGVTEIVESVVGYDGIVVSNAMDAPTFELTREHLFRALAKGHGEPAKWSDIDPSLPELEIEVLGPPPSSGTRDAFEELVLHAGGKAAGLSDDEIKELEIRTDGAWIDAGENDNLMVSKLTANPNAVAVFGFSFLDQNSDTIKGASIEGVEPEFEAIAAGDYKVSRSLYYYLKKAHVGVIPGIAEYAAEFASEAAVGEDGYLVDKGLIPLTAEAFDANKENISNLSSMVGDVLN